MNIAGNAEGQARLRAHGFGGVPIVCADDRCVPGGDLQAIADLVGFDYEPPVMLPPAELYAKWDHILAGACRYLRQIPDEGLTLTPPDRPRTLRDLGYHVVSIARVFIHAYDEGERESWRGIGGTTPEALLSGADLADYGEETRRLLAEWWRDAGSQDPLDRVLETYWGAHNLHECLERETWHTGQHTRQVMMFLEGMDIPPDRPLTAEDLAGLPMPSGVWD